MPDFIHSINANFNSPSLLKMRILLITPASAGGHHNEYKGLLAKAFSELGHEVLYFSPNNYNTKKENQLIKAETSDFKFTTRIYSRYYKYIFDHWQIHRHSIRAWRVLFEQINNLQEKNTPADLIFFECLDASIGQYITSGFIDRNLIIPFSGILLSPSDTRQMTKSFIRRGPFDPYNILKSKWCVSICVLMAEALPILSALIDKPVIVLPDVVSIPLTIQNKSLGDLISDRAGNRTIIGIWGSLEKRKGTSEFLQMVLKMPQENYFFVMGGLMPIESWSGKDKDVVQQGTSGIIKNLLIYNQWLTDDELLSGMRSCNLIFAAYQDWRFSSGIIGKAAAVEIPILVNDGFVMGKRVKEFKTGFVKDEKTDAGEWVSDNINEIKELSISSSFKEGCKKFCERHGYQQWRKSLALIFKSQSA